MKNHKHRSQVSAGVTLVELLVVISIMAVVAAFAIPRVRMISKDRKIREAARVVGEIVVASRDRAIGDQGAAGLLIERNPNFVFNGNIHFAATTLYQMRRVPNYVDDYGNDSVTIEAPDSGIAGRQMVSIGLPWEQIDRGVIRVDDQIRFNHSQVRYRVALVTVDTAPDPDQLKIEFEVNPDPTGTAARPYLRVGEDYTYIIERKPRKIESSRVDLPEGHLIDLRYSGELDVLDEDLNLDSTSKFSLAGDNQPIEIIFDIGGGIHRINYAGQSVLPSGSIHFFITKYDPTAIDPTDTYVNVAQKVLSDPSSLWVTLNDRFGGVNLGYNAPPNFTGTVFDAIYDCQTISRRRTNTAQ